MTITSVGYDGTVNETQWAKLSRFLGARYSVADSASFAPSIVSGVDRTVSIAAGTAYGQGVMDTSDAAVSVQCATVASGTRWDTIVLRRDWQPAGGSSTLVAVQGTSTQAVSGSLLASPGVQDDQPIALVQLTAGQQLPTALVDLRTWAHKVATANDLLALPNADLGVEAFVNGVRYRRELVSGSLAWVQYPKDSGFLSTVMTAASGWSIDIQSNRKMGNVAQINFTVTRTGSSISSTADGDIGNVTIATITDAAWKPLLTTAVAHNGVGVIAGMSLNTAGSLQVSALLPNITLATNDRLSGSLTYLVTA